MCNNQNKKQQHNKHTAEYSTNDTTGLPDFGIDPEPSPGSTHGLFGHASANIQSMKTVTNNTEYDDTALYDASHTPRSPPFEPTHATHAQTHAQQAQTMQTQQLQIQIDGKMVLPSHLQNANSTNTLTQPLLDSAAQSFVSPSLAHAARAQAHVQAQMARSGSPMVLNMNSNMNSHHAHTHSTHAHESEITTLSPARMSAMRDKQTTPTQLQTHTQVRSSTRGFATPQSSTEHNQHSVDSVGFTQFSTDVTT